jgi:hypothetical protein
MPRKPHKIYNGKVLHCYKSYPFGLFRLWQWLYSSDGIKKEFREPGRFNGCQWLEKTSVAINGKIVG